MFQWHFENCLFSPNPSPAVLEHRERLRQQTIERNVRRTGLPNVQVSVTCPYCRKVGRPGPMKLRHFDNCKHKPI